MSCCVLNTGLANKFFQLVNMLLNKVLGENEKYVLYFHLKWTTFLANPIISIKDECKL